MAPSPNRNPLYAKIAIARKQLPNLDEAAYRALLHNMFGTQSAKELDFTQLSRLVEHLASLGANFTSKPAPKVRPHARSDYYSLANDEFGPTKRMICAIWHKLGYDMTSLDTRCQREFKVESFAWLRDWKLLKRLLTDLQHREREKELHEHRAEVEARF
ncbi:MAG: regulatory protein GemA [Desulfovibrionaceae bacterium]